MTPPTARPIAHPMTGVMASMGPKISPVRSASPQCGRSSAAPLPQAAAKASADMESARNRTEITATKLMARSLTERWARCQLFPGCGFHREACGFAGRDVQRHHMIHAAIDASMHHRHAAGLGFDVRQGQLLAAGVLQHEI